MISWEAIYDNGTSLKQFNKDGSENKYNDIDRRKLRRFNIYINDKMIYSLFLHENEKLIFRRRNLVRMSPKDNQEVREIVILVGYHELIDTPNGRRDVYALNYLHEDGTLELDNHRENLQLVQQEF